MKEIKKALLDYCKNSNNEQLKKIREKNLKNQNVNIARNKNISLLSKDDIKNINLIKNTNFNDNNLSSHSILDLLDNNNKI